MTLGELVGLLGRGWMHEQYEGCGIIRWACVDGRELSAWPVTYRPEAVIRVDGGSGGVGKMWMSGKGGRGWTANGPSIALRQLMKFRAR